MTSTPVMQKAHRAASVRILTFLMVGGTCLLVQYALVLVLTSWVMPDHRVTANVLAFLLSAQLNFLLSRMLTWGDRRQPGLAWADILLQAFHFNLTVLLALVVNTTVFWIVDSQTHSLFLAVVSAGAIGAVVTFVINHLLVFRSAPAAQGQ